MKFLRGWVLAVLFSLAPALCIFPGAREGAVKTPGSEEEEVKSFIRKDLLRSGAAESGLPKRNIFSPLSSFGPFSSSLLPLSGKAWEEPGQGEGETLSGQRQEAPGFSINLRYIGYIESARQTIGLIFLEGQALAVAEGEVIREGIRVGRISPAEIEILLPDSTARRFAIEGE